VGWIAGHTTAGVSITIAIPPIFDAYPTMYQADDVTAVAYEQALVEDLSMHTPDQPWWLAYLDTGAHDVVFPHAPSVSLYWNWPYVLVEAGPARPSPGGPVVTCATPVERYPTCSSPPTGHGWSPRSGTTPGPASAPGSR
jgi:hypothetical protein